MAQRDKFLGLDGLRGLAALLIMFRHCPRFLGSIGPQETYLAVDLFFALSGFVLAHAYGERLDRGLGGGAFMKARLIRLYPMYAAGLFFGVAALILEGANGAPVISPFAIASAAAMLPATSEWGGGGFLFPLNPPAWSLFLELLANLVMGFAWRAMSNRVLQLGAGLFAAVLVLSVIKYGDADAGWYWPTVGIGIARVGFSFIAGILAYRYRDRLTLPLGPFGAAVIAVVCLVFTPAPAWRPAYDLACILAVFPLLVVAGSKATTAGARVLAVLGVLSYPIYAIHQPLQRCVADLLQLIGLSPESIAPWGMWALAPGIVGCAWLLATRYDAPIRRRLTTALQPSAAPASQAA